MASSEIWAKRVAAWRASGRTADKYAAGRGFAGSTLRWWSSHLGTRGPALVRVVPVVERPRDSTLELAVGHVRMLVRTGFDRALLAEVEAIIGKRRVSIAGGVIASA